MNIRRAWVPGGVNPPSPSPAPLVLLGLLLSGLAFAAPQVTATSATVKLKPTDPVPEHQPVTLMGAKNEFQAFQIVVKGDGSGAANVTATLPYLEHPSGARIEAPHVTLYRAGYLNLTQMSFKEAPPGRYPDPLIPDTDEIASEKRNAFPFNVPPNESRIIWVDVLAPDDAPAGTYVGEVTVSGDGFETKVPVQLSVLETQLPSTSSLPTAFLFHRNLACRVHTGNSECASESDSLALRDKYQRMALEHRITLSNVFTFPNDGNWTLFGNRYSPWLDGTAKTRLAGAKMTSAQFHGARTAQNFLAWQGYFDERGWLPRAYDYTGDEPPYGISFEEARSRLQAVKAAAPKLRTLLTTTVQSADDHGISPFLDLVVPVINHIDGTEAPYVGNQRRAYDGFLEASPSKGFWAYQSCMSHGCAFGSNAPENNAGLGWPSYMVDASAARNRAMQWALFLLEAEGELYYETALALDTAWHDVFRFNGNGDGTLFYPGTPAQIGGSTHVPVASIRLKQIRQGMQDYEWLKKVADAGDPGFARQVAQSLVPASFQVGDDGFAYDRARQLLINRWVDLQPKDSHPLGPEAPSTPGTRPIGGIGGEGGGEGEALGGGATPGAKLPRVAGRLGCAMAGPQLFGVVGVAALAFALARRRRR